jgi:MoCo/4Fe-4S cofactor protein with predicted Tat translocation signal
MKPDKASALHLRVLQERLQSTSGREYWRSLEELADTKEFREFVEDEFPGRSAEWTSPLNRREVLRLMGASFALAGLTACTRMPPQKIVPYVQQPEEVIPGKPLYFATAMPVGGYAMGLLVESHLGRPTKIEGNPDHPASLGATDAMAQASILGLYDPERTQTVTQRGRISNYLGFLAMMSRTREQNQQNKGAGLRILTETITSPTFAREMQNILTQFPNARWYQYEPVHHSQTELYHFDQADVVLSLDSDFLGTVPGSIQHSRDFMSKRKLASDQPSMNRLYVVEPSPSITGSTADHRWPAKPSEIEGIARSIAARLGIGQASTAAPPWVDAVVRDLQAHKGKSLVIAGRHQAESVRALAAAMNQALGNVGVTVTGIQPVEANPVDQLQSLWSLVKEMASGQVETLMILGGNPVYTAPADMNFGSALQKVKLVIHNSLYFDETAEYSHWHIPEAHYLESWDDARAFDGTVTILQPLIAPLYGGRTSLEVLASLTDQPDRRSYDILRDYWHTRHTGEDFDAFWDKSLHDGMVANSAAATAPATAPGPIPPRASAPPGPGTLELNLRPDPYLFDGRFANNSWLQELPKPDTKLTWDNPVYVSPATAKRLGLENEDLVELENRGRKLLVAAWIVPGQADDCLTMYLGNGRRRGGRVATNAGFNAYLLRVSDQPWGGPGVQLRKTGDRHLLANTQGHHSMEGRGIVRSATLVEYQKDPEFPKHEEAEAPKSQSLYPEYSYTGHKWGMAIDQNACIGCSACVVACQAENNIPVVGKDQVLRGREMHWLRIDRYHKGDAGNPEMFNQPMLCQQCEKAPCELVCPVAATVHSNEGLNQMVYNRCVGTRYCSNNCPYKVRRFNFYLYSDWYTQSLYGMRNPNVTVRSRGVMEKCTYCVQRINYAKIEADREERPVRDGEIVTACQAACPTRAIVFGDMNDPESAVTRLKAQPLNYSVLGDLNTQPRTTYLARVKNTNPDLERT